MTIPETEEEKNSLFPCDHDFHVFFFFFFFFTPVQTPVTLCSGELRSILVVRLAQSADLRSRLRHVSSAPNVAYSTGCSRLVTHPGTNPAWRCLTSVIWREPVCHRHLAVDMYVKLKSLAHHRAAIQHEWPMQHFQPCNIDHRVPVFDLGLGQTFNSNF